MAVKMYKMQKQCKFYMNQMFVIVYNLQYDTFLYPKLEAET